MIKWKNIRTQKAKLTDLGSIAIDELNKTMESKVVPLLKAEHLNYVSGWNHQVSFIHQHLGGTDIVWLVYPASGEAGTIYEIVDLGAKPHTISGRPKLKFRIGGYRAKTTPYPAKKAAGKSGNLLKGQEVYANRVNHPGHKARQFSQTIAEKQQPKVEKILTDTLKKVATVVEE